MFSESDHAHGTEKNYIRLESHYFFALQRTFQHLAAANNTLMIDGVVSDIINIKSRHCDKMKTRNFITDL